MGMSTHVIGFIPPDAKWREMKDVYDFELKAFNRMFDLESKMNVVYPPVH